MRNRLFFILLVVILFLPGNAESTLQTELNTLQSVDRSESIVLATCVNAVFEKKEGTLLSNWGAFIFDVEDVVKGSPPLVRNQLTLRLGAMTKKRAPFAVGTRYILFLGRPNAQGYATLFGMEQTSLMVDASTSNLSHPAFDPAVVRLKSPVIGMGDLGLGNHPTVSDFIMAVRKHLAEKEKKREDR